MRFGEIETWDQDRTAEPTIRAYRMATATSRLSFGQVIEKAESRLVINVA